MTLLVETNYTDQVAATHRLKEVIERLEKLQAEQESTKEELTDHLGNKTGKAIAALIGYLKSPEVVKRFSQWDSDELPDVEELWEVTEAAIVKLFQNRLQTVIEEWEEKQQQFAEARKSVVTFFLRKYNYLEKELHNLEVDVSQIQITTSTRNESVADQFLNNIHNFSLPIEKKIALGLMTPFIIPTALVGIALTVPVSLLLVPVAGVKFITDHVKEDKKKRAYKKSRSDFVRDMSQEYLDKVATYEALKPLVEDQMAQAVTCLAELEAKIPMLVEADVKLCQQLMDVSQRKKDTEALYKPRKEKYERLRGELGLFGSLEIRSMQIAWNDLEWDVSEDVYLKHSLQPGMYKGRISRGRHATSRQVNMKVYKELLSTSNVTECLADQSTMR